MVPPVSYCEVNMAWSAARVVVLITVLSVPPALPLAAQYAPGPEPGSRVRVRTTQEPALWRRGLVVTVTPDSMAIDLEGAGGTITVPLSGIEHLETSTGHRRLTADGAGVGFGIGLALGLVLGVAVASSDCFGCEDAGAGSFIGAGLVLGGLGAGVGAIVGSTMTSERWQAGGPPAPRGGGAASRGYRLGFQLAF